LITKGFQNTLTINRSVSGDNLTLSPDGGTLSFVGTGSIRTVPAAHACVAILAETLARLPWQVVDKNQPTVERRLVGVQAILENPATDVDEFTFWNGLLRDLFINGNAYAYIRRDNRQAPVKLYHGSLSEIRRVSGAWNYRLNILDDNNNGTVTTNLLRPNDVLHFRWTQYNPFTGLSDSPITFAAKEALKLYEATYKHQSSVLSKGVHAPMIIRADTQLIAQIGASEYKKLTKAVQAAQGLNEAGKPFTLPAGFDAKQAGFSSLDMQLLEIARFTVEDIARVYGVPLFMLQVNQGKATEPQGSNLQEQFTAFQRTAIASNVARLTSELTRKLLTNEQKRTLRVNIPSEKVSMGTMQDVVGGIDTAVQ